jgi:hypothetical protein
MEIKQIISFLSDYGFNQYADSDYIVSRESHVITIQDGQILFEDQETGYEDYEDLDVFDSLEDLLSWIYGVQDFLLDEEE